MRAGGGDVAQFGRPGGARARYFTIVRLDMFMTFIPAASSGQGLEVLSYSEVPVSVELKSSMAN
ncbi:hypothetical protein GCM10009554_42690 [Kribbella koreensis]|uniref:Uncharacterized protein n=2 Tax=Kribbella TaxID=182639 RepID=A0ABP6VR14_9ACTN